MQWTVLRVGGVRKFKPGTAMVYPGRRTLVRMSLNRTCLKIGHAGFIEAASIPVAWHRFHGLITLARLGAAKC